MLQDWWVHKVLMAQKGILDLLVLWGGKALRGLEGSREIEAHLVIQDHRDFKVRLVHRVSKVT